MNYTNEKINNLVIDWIELTERKNNHARKQEYELAAINRDKQRNIERDINKIIGEEYNSTAFYGYIKEYLADKYGINLDLNSLDNTTGGYIRKTIREIRLNQLGI